MGCRYDLHHVRTMVTTFLDNSLKSLQRIRTLKIMKRPDKDRTVFMSDIAHSLRHLLGSFNLNIHIAGACLDSLAKSLFGNLRSLDLSALRSKCRVLKRWFGGHQICYPASRHKRYIRRKALLDIPERKVAAIQAYFRHLATFESLENLLKILILYSRTNHIITLSSQ